MTVQQLIEELEQMNPESEVRFASQPSWPFEYSITSVVEVFEGDDDEENEYIPTENDVPVVYLEEGAQLGYLPDNVRETLNW